MNKFKRFTALMELNAYLIRIREFKAAANIEARARRVLQA